MQNAGGEQMHNRFLKATESRVCEVPACSLCGHSIFSLNPHPAVVNKWPGSNLADFFVSFFSFFFFSLFLFLFFLSFYFFLSVCGLAAHGAVFASAWYVVLNSTVALGSDCSAILPKGMLSKQIYPSEIVEKIVLKM